ncbi:MAG: class II aldolase/adducin family protein [Acidobacteria bacterium]|nr:class II aldolase/adducin family protein [Acidobacteriota bacterium]
MPRTENEYREEMVEIGRRLHQQGFVAATAGNLSVRLDAQRFLTTPTNVSKGLLHAEDLILVDGQGNRLSGQQAPSSELGMHLLIYQMRPEVAGVVHAHPPTATGYAAAGLALDQALVAETVVALGSVPLARYGTPGSPELSEALRELIPHHNAILMANHGVVAFGEDLWQAYFHMETVEHLARVSLVTVLLGQQAKLSRQDVEKLMELRSRRT